MLYAKFSKVKNVYTDYTVGGETPPDEFDKIPKELEAKFFIFFPFAMPVFDGECVVDIIENLDAKNAPKPTPPPDPLDEIRLAIAELAVAMTGGAT